MLLADSFISANEYLPQLSYILQRRKGVSTMLSGFGTTEILVIASVLLILFGGKKLPELARGMGDSVKEFRKAVKEQ